MVRSTEQKCTLVLNTAVQLIPVAFEHCVLRVLEVYGLYGP